MNTYELLYIVPPPYSEKELPDIQKNIDKIVKEAGAKILHEENWGDRKLAYPIKQARRGFYILIHFESEPESLKKIDSKFKLTPEILRFQIIKLKKPTPKKEIIKSPEKSSISKKPAKSVDLKTLGEKIDKLLEI